MTVRKTKFLLVAVLCVGAVAVATGGVLAATILCAPMISTSSDKYKTIDDAYVDPRKATYDSPYTYGTLGGVWILNSRFTINS